MPSTRPGLQTESARETENSAPSAIAPALLYNTPSLALTGAWAARATPRQPTGPCSRLWLLLRPTSCIHAVVLRKMSRECRVILVDNPIEQVLLGTVALVTTSTPVLGGRPGRCCVGHDPRTVEPHLVSFSTSWLMLRSSLR